MWYNQNGRNYSVKYFGKLITKNDDLVVSDTACLPREDVFSTGRISDKTTTLSLVYFSINAVRISTKNAFFLTGFYFD